MEAAQIRIEGQVFQEISLQKTGSYINFDN